MEPVTSGIAIYQLASAVGALCFEYGGRAKKADRSIENIIDEINRLQKSLRTLEKMRNEEITKGQKNRLQNMDEFLTNKSASMENCKLDLERLHLKLTNAQSKTGVKQKLHKLSWPLKKDEAERTVLTMRTFSEAIDRALSIDTNEVVRQTENRVRRIEFSMETRGVQQKREKESREELENRQKAESDKRRIMEWLSHPDPVEYHNVACRARNDAVRTGRWFFDGSSYHQFKETPRSVLWLHGDPGRGKTVLCSSIIDDIKCLAAECQNIRLAYWYFSKTDKRRTTLDNLIRSLTTQFLINDLTPKSLEDYWKGKREGKDLAKIPDLVQILPKAMLEMGHTYFIVLDAVDEAGEDERDEVLDLVRDIVYFEHIDVHVVVASQSNAFSVRQRLQEVAGSLSVGLDRENINHDISNHVRERLQNDRRLNQWPSDLKAKVEIAINTRASGMFRWADCQLQEIRKCKRPKDLDKMLRNLPKDLHQQYTKDLANISHNATQDARKLLGWLIFPQRGYVSEITYWLVSTLTSTAFII